jgi:hypothetical protein
MDEVYINPNSMLNLTCQVYNHTTFMDEVYISLNSTFNLTCQVYNHTTSHGWGLYQP